MSHELVTELWYFSRAAGVVALVSLTASIALGIVSRSGRSALGIGRFGVSELHRTVALLAVGLVLAHVITLLFDPYAQLHVVDVLLPFNAGYRPFWVGLGTVALDLLIVVIGVSLVRDRLGLRVFRAVHWAVYAMWPIALTHDIGSGTDAHKAWMLYLDLACCVVVLTLVLWRVSASYAERGWRREPRVVPKGAR